MRHGKKFNHLGRSASHRKALLANQAKSLVLHKRIVTTVAKAKALRKFIEPIITKSRVNATHARRIVFAHFQDKEPVKVLFNEIVPKIGNRPGGYTRIIKMGTRLGDNAEMCMMELVDYNEVFQKDTKRQKTKTRRRKSKASVNNSQEVLSEAQKKEAAEDIKSREYIDTDGAQDAFLGQETRIADQEDTVA